MSDIEEKVKALEDLRTRLRAQYKALEDSGRAEVGDFTYGMPAVISWGEEAKVKIGKFCSIGANVQIYLGGNHRNDWCSTYPFNVLLKNVYPGIDGEVAATKGDVIIGNDVWIANNVSIMSGVKIGDGATIANGAVVTKDVPKYTIVGGVPARVRKWKASAAMTEELRWWDWPLEKLAEAIPIIMSKGAEALISFSRNYDIKLFADGEEIKT